MSFVGCVHLVFLVKVMKGLNCDCFYLDFWLVWQLQDGMCPYYVQTAFWNDFCLTACRCVCGFSQRLPDKFWKFPSVRMFSFLFLFNWRILNLRKWALISKGTEDRHSFRDSITHIHGSDGNRNSCSPWKEHVRGLARETHHETQVEGTDLWVTLEWTTFKSTHIYEPKITELEDASSICPLIFFFSLSES